MDDEQVLKDFLEDYDIDEILYCLDEDDILNYILNSVSTNYVLRELPFEEVTEYVLDRKSHYILACDLDDDAILDRAKEVEQKKVEQKDETLGDYYKRKHFEEIFDKYSLEEIEQALPLKY